MWAIRQKAFIFADTERMTNVSLCCSYAHLHPHPPPHTHTHVFLLASEWSSICNTLKGLAHKHSWQLEIEAIESELSLRGERKCLAKRKSNTSTRPGTDLGWAWQLASVSVSLSLSRHVACWPLAFGHASDIYCTLQLTWCLTEWLMRFIRIHKRKKKQRQKNNSWFSNHIREYPRRRTCGQRLWNWLTLMLKPTLCHGMACNQHQQPTPVAVAVQLPHCCCCCRMSSDKFANDKMPVGKSADETTAGRLARFVRSIVLANKTGAKIIEFFLEF